jgi:hypothetical protein
MNQYHIIGSVPALDPDNVPLTLTRPAQLDVSEVPVEIEIFGAQGQGHTLATLKETAEDVATVAPVAV